jgi:Spy/CpxP family protein refolding chaperone
VQKRVEETNREISAILTPEQQKKLTQMEDEHRKRMSYRHPFGEPPGTPSPSPTP